MQPPYGLLTLAAMSLLLLTTIMTSTNLGSITAAESLVNNASSTHLGTFSSSSPTSLPTNTELPFIPIPLHASIAATSKPRAARKCVQTEHTTTIELRNCLLSTYDRMAPPFLPLPSTMTRATNTSTIVRHRPRAQLDSSSDLLFSPINVTLTMFPTNLMEVDDKQQQITTHFFVTMSWRDRRLSWRRRLGNTTHCSHTALQQQAASHNPEQQAALDYVEYYDTATSGICRRPLHNVVYFNQSQTWLPSLVILERLNDGIGGSYYLDRLIKDAYFLQEITIAVDAKGRVTLRGFFVERCACRMMTRLFPFDYQTCNLSVMVRAPVAVNYVNVYENRYGDEDDVGHHGMMMSGEYGGDKPASASSSDRRAAKNTSGLDRQLTKGYDLGEWRLDVRAARLAPHTWHIDASEWEASLWIYQLGLIRNPMQHLLTWVIPPVITSVGAILGLYLGCNPSERYKFGSSIVITLILMMTGINERLPVSDDGYPVLGVLYFGLCIIVTVAAFLSTIPTKLRQYFRQELDILHRNHDHSEVLKFGDEPPTSTSWAELRGRKIMRARRRHVAASRENVIAHDKMSNHHHHHQADEPLLSAFSSPTDYDYTETPANNTAVAEMSELNIMMKRTTTQMTPLGNDSNHIIASPSNSNTAAADKSNTVVDVDTGARESTFGVGVDEHTATTGKFVSNGSIRNSTEAAAAAAIALLPIRQKARGDDPYSLSRARRATFDGDGDVVMALSPTTVDDETHDFGASLTNHHRDNDEKTDDEKMPSDAFIGDKSQQHGEIRQQQNENLYLNFLASSSGSTNTNGIVPTAGDHDDDDNTLLQDGPHDVVMANGGSGTRHNRGDGHHTVQRTATSQSKASSSATSIVLRHSLLRLFLTVLLKRRRFDMLLMAISLLSQTVLIAYAVKEWSDAVRNNKLILR